ncbi:hypothetical protein [Sorangium sp. So ce128]|uniref:hypothetical protein n=1 Tax=Sorangium sp. So ce128 TaxID=3133281 RepID=UPI003F61C511
MREEHLWKRAIGPGLAIAVMSGCAQILGADWENYRVGDGSEEPGGSGAGGQGTDTTPEESRTFRLPINDQPEPGKVFELDKTKTLELLGDDGAKRITLLDIDTTGLLRSALEQIQNACGTSWQNDNANPGHDCSLTELGRSFGAEWRTSPEFALVRLLSMTPANADVTGTSFAELQALFDENPGTFALDFADILADSITLDLAVQPDPTSVRSNRTTPLVPMDKLISALQQQLLGTHPAISDPKGKSMPINLYEALHDLEALDQKLGPSGDHPGVLVPDDGTFTTHSDLLQLDFSMRIVAEPGLRRVSGVDLSSGLGAMFHREGDAPLRFDFNDPEKLQISGIAPAPIVVMRIALHELPTAVSPCIGEDDPDCRTNSPNTPVGTDHIWSVPPYLLESIVGTAGYLTYRDRVPFSGCYWRAGGTCVLGVNIGQEGKPPGWSVFLSSISFPPDPPPQVPGPQFFWELLTDVAQTAIHDPTGDGNPEILEGAAQPVLALHNVSIGLTADEIVADLRPTLQSQAKEIAELIMGRYWENDDPLDFYCARSAPGGAPTLFFVAEGDLRPSDRNSNVPRAYTYESPGFFTSPDLSEASKVSRKELDGISDKTHEKYRLPPGETTLFMQDDEGTTFKVRFQVPDEEDPVEITAEVTRL